MEVRRVNDDCRTYLETDFTGFPNVSVHVNLIIEFLVHLNYKRLIRGVLGYSQLLEQVLYSCRGTLLLVQQSQLLRAEIYWLIYHR